MHLYCDQWQTTQCSFTYFEQCIYCNMRLNYPTLISLLLGLFLFFYLCFFFVFFFFVFFFCCCFVVVVFFFLGGVGGGGG